MQIGLTDTFIKASTSREPVSAIALRDSVKARLDTESGQTVPYKQQSLGVCTPLRTGSQEVVG